MSVTDYWKMMELGTCKLNYVKREKKRYLLRISNKYPRQQMPALR